MPVKVYELAKELRISNTDMVGELRRLGMANISPASDLTDEDAEKIRSAHNNNGSDGANGTGSAPSATTTSGSVVASATATRPSLEIPNNITVKELGERLGLSASEIQKVLMNMGVLAALNQRLAADAINRIAAKLGRTVMVVTTPSASATLTAPAAPVANRQSPSSAGNGMARPGTPAANKSGRQAVAVSGRTATDLVTRPPVVTIMGHVDHGKTTLLDTIRKASVADGEAGGITQHIGAYQVEHQGKRITFLDTPGHEAFSAMRRRGASVTDIIVIVVAANDGIMPQTTEAIKIAKESGAPMVIAINKMDLPEADPDRVLSQLTEYEIVAEAYGGDTPTVNISAKKGEGIDELLDTLLLVSEVIIDPKADPHGKAQGTVIEARLEKGRGAVVSVLVQQGTLTMGDIIVAGGQYGRIRGMMDERGNRLTKAGPSSPVEIVGLNSVPEPGDGMEVTKDEREARALAEQRAIEKRENRLTGGGSGRSTLAELYQTLIHGEIKELNIVVKGDVQGSVQAVRDSIATLGNDEVRVRVLSTGVGQISDNDILLASSDKNAEEKNSLIVGFNVGLAGGADKKAQQEHVQIKTFSIIYQLIDFVKEALVGLMDPIYEEAVIGKVEVRQLFRLPGGRGIAGCMVTNGMVRRNAKVRIYRGKDLLHTGDIDTLRRFKEDAREVQEGYDCGIMVKGFNGFEIGDTMECFEMREIKREL